MNQFRKKFLIFGPIQLLELWLNATFEPSLEVDVPYDMERKIEVLYSIFLLQMKTIYRLKNLSKNTSSCV